LYTHGSKCSILRLLQSFAVLCRWICSRYSTIFFFYLRVTGEFFFNLKVLIMKLLAWKLWNHIEVQSISYFVLDSYVKTCKFLWRPSSNEIWISCMYIYTLGFLQFVSLKAVWCLTYQNIYSEREEYKLMTFTIPSKCERLYV
jgi:hypothetical protein